MLCHYKIFPTLSYVNYFTIKYIQEIYLEKIHIFRFRYTLQFYAAQIFLRQRRKANSADINVYMYYMNIHIK